MKIVDSDLRDELLNADLATLASFVIPNRFSYQASDEGV
jgi:hypothetical protein